MTKRAKSFKARHRKNIKKGRCDGLLKINGRRLCRYKERGTKGDMVRAIKGIELHLMQLQQHIVMIDNILDKYIVMKKDKDKFVEFMEMNINKNNVSKKAEEALKLASKDMIAFGKLSS